MLPVTNLASLLPQHIPELEMRSSTCVTAPNGAVPSSRVESPSAATSLPCKSRSLDLLKTMCCIAASVSAVLLQR
jgi:hypothetical protein